MHTTRLTQPATGALLAVLPGCLRASGLCVLLLNCCSDFDARASAAPPLGTESGKPAAGALCLPRRAREKRPTRRSNGPPAAWIYFTQIHESTYENHRSVIGELV
eukprot:COSAG06_NODE_1524_length_9197_cov_21.393430_4_plen_105_part_00